MTDNSQENKEEAPLWLVLIIIIVVPLAILYFALKIFLSSYWIDRQANIQIQNPDHIKQSCLYFTGYFNTKYAKNHQRYRVDDIVFNNSDSMGYLGDVGDPMTAEKHHQFYDDVDKYQNKKCYKVAYVHLDYWIVKKTYLYDYFGVE